MLYWTWACVFLIVAILLALIDFGRDESGDATGLSALCTLASVAFLWPVAGNRVFAWLDAHLPQPATPIHFATAVVLFCLIVIAYRGSIFATAEGIGRLWTKRRVPGART